MLHSTCIQMCSQVEWLGKSASTTTSEGWKLIILARVVETLVNHLKLEEIFPAHGCIEGWYCLVRTLIQRAHLPPVQVASPDSLRPLAQLVDLKRGH